MYFVKRGLCIMPEKITTENEILLHLEYGDCFFRDGVLRKKRKASIKRSVKITAVLPWKIG